MQSRRLQLLSVWFVALSGLLSAAERSFQIITPEKTVTITASEFAALPRTELNLPARDNQKERHFSGVAMRTVLEQVGAPLGDKLRGRQLQTSVIVRCRDNYAVLFALAEFDENFSDRTILLADQEDGEPLPPSAAPFRVVVPGDKRGARSCQQVLTIEIVPPAKS